ncbi:Xylose operon regulatory protein [Rosistilla oblonga]|nr:Xylose operon regulatory protein [Rosistilla oblonga]
MGPRLDHCSADLRNPTEAMKIVQQRRSVALLVETSNAYARGVLAGIIDYIQQHQRWSLVLPEQERGARPPDWLQRWQGDGIIARIETDEIAQAIRRTQCPVVDVSAARHLPGVPWVETDDDAIARIAVEHLVERGFRHLAFCGDSGFNWSQWRQQAFEQYVQQAGGTYYQYDSIPRHDPEYSWNSERARLAQWVKQLPHPIGIFACYDIKAQQLLDVCRELNIAVPEQIAVLGVDNDRLLCDLADPPLSSVSCNTRRTGYEAAAMLDRMMAGDTIGAEKVLLEPLGIQTRQSTDILATDDPDVAAAVRFIREHACDGIKVVDVLNEVPVSRRVLEKRFVKILGRSPHEEITRLRIDRVKQLLVQTDLSLAEIARRTGYRHDEYLSVAFKNVVGVQPSKYRQSAKTSS